MMNRVLAVDPGEKRIGVAVSDLSKTIANPLTVVKHVSRTVDAAIIVQLASEQAADLIVVGLPLDEDGLVGFAARRSQKLAEAIRQQTNIAIEFWDETGSTWEARQARIVMGTSRRKRSGHLDELAATCILQAYLDHHSAADNTRTG
jgi:putative Holliday junction resolvase